MLILDMEVSHVRICTECGGLKGHMPIKDKNYHLHCRCERVKGKFVQKLPPGYDLAPFIDLCFCCGLTPIRSGSRWSAFFCADCMKMVKRLNGTFGSAIIPVGRHSLMNSVVLEPAEVRNKEKIREFAENLGSLFQRMDWIFYWRSLAVLRAISELDLGNAKSIPYEKFILNAGSTDRYAEKAKSFRRLGAYMDVPDWYFAAESPTSFSSN
jgi:hypothetical protein